MNSKKTSSDLLMDHAISFCNGPPATNGHSTNGTNGTNGHNLDEPAVDEEQRHYNRVSNVFHSYRSNSRDKVLATKSFIKSFPESRKELLKEYAEHLNSILPCIDANQQIFDLMVKESAIFECHSEMYPSDMTHDSSPKPNATETGQSSVDTDKCHVVLKQLVRDWSAQGRREREMCYTPILEELDSRFSSVKCKSDIRVLVPGAGVGRLAHEILRRGYCTEGNEFSLYMLFASNFILNRCSEKDKYRCYPWIHQNSNVLCHKDQITHCSFPDLDPSDLPPNAKLVMTAGDFGEVFSRAEHAGAWDCVVTCFFVDCAKNIVDFLETIYSCLKENGVWINLGPLLYHYADIPEEKSIEPSYDFLATIIQRIGFKIEKEVLDIPTQYGDNPRSMLSFTYKSVFLVCKKSVGSTN